MSKEANVGLVTSILAAFKNDAPEEVKEEVVEEVVEETEVAEEESTDPTEVTETEETEVPEQVEVKTELNSAELTIQLIESGITDPALLRAIATAVDTGDITALLTKLIETKAAKPGTVLDKQEINKVPKKRSIV